LNKWKYRKCRVVGHRATILSPNVKELPVKAAKLLLSEITGLHNQTTLKAYFETQKHKPTLRTLRG
jgi:hypothetical protein